MKTLIVKIIIIIHILFIINMQEKQKVLEHEVSVINIEVPVRVYKGNEFVENLEIDDFELYENGELQKIEALYLVKKEDIKEYIRKENNEQGERTEANINNYNRNIGKEKRVILLYYEMDEYPLALNKSIDYLFDNIIKKTDIILIVTPIAQWKISMNEEKMNIRSDIANELKSRLKKSLWQAGYNVKAIIRDIRDLSIFDDADISYWRRKVLAEDMIEKLLNIKVINEKQFNAMAEYLKSIDAQKHVFIFYQQETYPMPTEFKKYYGERVYDRNERINKNKIRELFSDGGTTVHFMYYKKNKMARGDIEYREEGGEFDAEMNGDIFQGFNNLAIETGGVAISSYNPEYAMKRMTNAAENYYLLYYKPSFSSIDKSYKKIEVKIKSGNYKVIHRSGYIDK